MSREPTAAGWVAHSPANWARWGERRPARRKVEHPSRIGTRDGGRNLTAEILVRIARLSHGDDLPLPSPASRGSAGLDLRAAVEGDLVLQPRARAQVPTGIRIEIPPGWEGQVRPRSGLAARFGITLLNSPGTIDSDYRGEVQVIVVNLGEEPFTIRRGDRIAQLVIAPVATIRVEESAELNPTIRGENGFGSSGID